MNNKAQKGWLSRWTRKQWSRHWFVLKNGSLTYYRGPAAELCSFLDGVLDLSLIKHIEVQQEEIPTGNATNQQQQQQQQHYGTQQNLYHYHHLQGHQPAALGVGATLTGSGNSAVNGGQQFTFSLKMWNGECHLLGAASAADRSLWLEAINACINGDADDDAATDSASSSDSSPTSNLSAKSIDIGSPKSRYTTLAGSVQNSSGDIQLTSCKPSALSRLTGSRTIAHQEVTVERHSNILPPIKKQPEIQQQDKRKFQMDTCAVYQRPRFGPSTINSSQNNNNNHNNSNKDSMMRNSISSQEIAAGELVSSQRSASNKEISQAETANRQQFSVASDENNDAEEEDDDDDDKEDDVSDSSETNEESEDDEEEEVESQQQQQQQESNESNLISFDSHNQALKRRMVSCLQSSRLLDSSNEPFKLITRQQPREQQQITGADLLYPSKRAQRNTPSSNSDSTTTTTAAGQIERPEDEQDQEMNSAASSDPSSPVDLSEDDGDDDEVVDDDKIRQAGRTDAATSSSSLSELDPQLAAALDHSATPSTMCKQKKRVTFDLSLSSMHQLTSSSESSSCTSGSDSDSSLISSSSPVSSEDERDDDVEGDVGPAREVNEHERSSCPSELQNRLPLPVESKAAEEDVTMSAACGPEKEPTASASSSSSRDKTEELEAQLDEARGSIDQLERKLSGSYANYTQLEANYKRLQAELSKCEELHRCDLNRMQVRVDELTRELTVSQLQLVETRDKLIKYEEHLAKQQENIQNQPPPTTTHSTHNKLAQNAPVTRSNSQTRNHSNWLKASQQVSACNLAQHQPLLFMHHVKHTLTANQQQQTLGLKLLNHSKQIQRKLNELELKVDQIQSTTAATSLVN